MVVDAVEELGLLMREAATEVDVDRLVTRISEAARRLVGCDYGGLALVSADGQGLTWRGMVGNRTSSWRTRWGRTGRGPVRLAQAAKRTVVLQGLDEDLDSTSRTQIAEGGRTLVVTPLPTREGAEGVMLLGWRTDASPTEGMISLIEMLAAHAALALDGALLREQREAYEQQSSAVLRVTRAFALQPDRDQVLRLLLDEAVQLLGATTGVVRRFDEANERLETVAIHGIDGAEAKIRPIVEAKDDAPGHQLRIPRIDRFEVTDSPAESLGTRAIARAPILLEGRFMGAVSVGSRTPGSFSQHDLEVLEVLAGAAAAALMGAERAELRGILLAAATAQHEINNRLALTVGYCELLARDPLLPEKLKPLTEEALRGAQECAQVVATMQDLTSADRIMGPGPLGPSLRLTGLA